MGGYESVGSVFSITERARLFDEQVDLEFGDKVSTANNGDPFVTIWHATNQKLKSQLEKNLQQSLVKTPINVKQKSQYIVKVYKNSEVATIKFKVESTALVLLGSLSDAQFFSAKDIIVILGKTIKMPEENSVFDHDNMLAMPFIEGKTLNELMVQTAFEDLNKLNQVAIRLFRAICCLHDLNIVHRDLSPSNVLVDISGEVRLVDFAHGIIKTLDSDLIKKQIVQRGTSGFNAPEVDAENAELQLGEYFGSCDIFSIGCLLYFLLSEELLNTLDETIRKEQLARLGNNHPELVDLVGVIEKAVKQQPQDRYESVKQLSDAWGLAWDAHLYKSNVGYKVEKLKRGLKYKKELSKTIQGALNGFRFSLELLQRKVTPFQPLGINEIQEQSVVLDSELKKLTTNENACNNVCSDIANLEAELEKLLKDKGVVLSANDETLISLVAREGAVGCFLDDLEEARKQQSDRIKYLSEKTSAVLSKCLEERIMGIESFDNDEYKEFDRLIKNALEKEQNTQLELKALKQAWEDKPKHSLTNKSAIAAVLSKNSSELDKLQQNIRTKEQLKQKFNSQWKDLENRRTEVLQIARNTFPQNNSVNEALPSLLCQFDTLKIDCDGLIKRNYKTQAETYKPCKHRQYNRIYWEKIWEDICAQVSLVKLAKWCFISLIIFFAFSYFTVIYSHVTSIISEVKTTTFSAEAELEEEPQLTNEYQIEEQSLIKQSVNRNKTTLFVNDKSNGSNWSQHSEINSSARAIAVFDDVLQFEPLNSPHQAYIISKPVTKTQFKKVIDIVESFPDITAPVLINSSCGGQKTDSSQNTSSSDLCISPEQAWFYLQGLEMIIKVKDSQFATVVNIQWPTIAMLKSIRENNVATLAIGDYLTCTYYDSGNTKKEHCEMPNSRPSAIYKVYDDTIYSLSPQDSHNLQLRVVISDVPFIFRGGSN